MNWLPEHEVDSNFLAEAAAQVTRAPSKSSFASQLLSTVHLSATDPREKVFAILGISAFSDKKIVSDYTKLM